MARIARSLPGEIVIRKFNVYAGVSTTAKGTVALKTTLEATKPSTIVNQPMTTTAPDQGSLFGNATWINNGPGNSYLQLTSATNSENGQIEFNGALPTNFDVVYNFYTSDFFGADAQYFYWGCASTPTGEDDSVGGYIFAFDEYNGEGNPYAWRFNGSLLSSQGSVDFTNRVVQAILKVRGNTLTVFIDGVQKFTFTDTTETLGGTLFGWGARTGGVNAEHDVSNLTISNPTDNATIALLTTLEATSNNIILQDDYVNAPPQFGSVTNSAVWQSSGYVELTQAVNNQSGYVEYSGNLPNDFIMQFQFRIPAPGADAVYFYWGDSSVPPSFDSAENGYHFVVNNYSGAGAPLQLFWNGTLIASFSGTFIWDDNAWHTFKTIFRSGLVYMYIDNTLLLSFDDTANWPRSFGGNLFGIGGRTGGVNSEHDVRNFSLNQLGNTIALSANLIIGRSTLALSANLVRTHHRVVATDDFNRADGPFGSNWTTGVLATAPAILNDKATNPTPNQDNNAYWSANPFFTDQYSQAQLIQINSGIDDFSGVTIRATTTDQVELQLNKNANAAQIVWYNAGAFTLIGSQYVFPSDPTGAIFLLEAVGHVFTAYMNGTQIIQGTNISAPTTGSAGIKLGGTNANDSLWDNWEGGDYFNAGTVALTTFLEATKDVNVALKTTLESSVKKSTVALYTDLLLATLGKGTVAMLTLFEQPSAIALLTTLEASVQNATIALKTTLVAQSNIALKTTLETAGNKSTVALYAPLFPRSITVALKTTLEIRATKELALLTILETTPNKSTVALKTTLETVKTHGTVALFTSLIGTYEATVALKTTLETIPHKSTIATKTTLEANKRSTLALKTTLEKTVAIGFRVNLIPNPSFEIGGGWNVATL